MEKKNQIITSNYNFQSILKSIQDGQNKITPSISELPITCVEKLEKSIQLDTTSFVKIHNQGYDIKSPKQFKN